MLYVADFMTPEPLLVAESEPVSAVSRYIKEHGIHHLLVVDSEGNLAGIVSKRDLRKAAERRREGKAPLVRDIMTSDVTSVDPQTSLSDAIGILSREHFGALPVLVGRRVVGMLSTYDLLRLLNDMLNTRSRIAATLREWPAECLPVSGREV